MTSDLPLCISSSFISFLDALAETSNIILGRSRESGHPCCVPDFTGHALAFTPLSIMYAASLLNIAYILLMSLYPYILHDFHKKGD